MTELQFINAMSTKHRNSVIANELMNYANRQHHIAVKEARARKAQREAAREYRNLRRVKRLNAALLVASMIGVAVATWFLTSIGAA